MAVYIGTIGTRYDIFLSTTETRFVLRSDARKAKMRETARESTIKRFAQINALVDRE